MHWEHTRAQGSHPSAAEPCRGGNFPSQDSQGEWLPSAGCPQPGFNLFSTKAHTESSWERHHHEGGQHESMLTARAPCRH